jgi:hypothetical protein
MKEKLNTKGKTRSAAGPGRPLTATTRYRNAAANKTTYSVKRIFSAIKGGRMYSRPTKLRWYNKFGEGLRLMT